MGKKPCPKPQHLAAKLLAIRNNFGYSQRSMAMFLLVVAPKRLSEFESGRRMPNWLVLLYYARLAGIPLEFIVDDELDLATFKKALAVADSKRDELHDPVGLHVTGESYITLFWRWS